MPKYKQRKGASKRASGGSRWFVSGKTSNKGSKRYKPANYKKPKFKDDGAYKAKGGNQGGHERNKITESTNIDGKSLVASPRSGLQGYSGKGVKVKGGDANTQDKNKALSFPNVK